MAGTCERCGAVGATVSLGGEVLCDRCVDNQISEFTGMPRLPDPPADEVFTGPDARAHRFRFRLWRAPTGVSVEAAEIDCPTGEGYQLKLLGQHDADIDALLSSLRERITARISRVDLTPNPHREGWMLAGETVSGRFEWNDEGDSGKPYDVVVDGRRLSWGEFGNAFEGLEGWGFTLHVDDLSSALGEDTGLVADIAPWPASQQSNEPDFFLGEDDDDAFLEAWDHAEAEAVELLQRALPELRDEPPPAGELADAVLRLRAGLKGRRWPHRHMGSAAGFDPVQPMSRLELWLGAAGGLIAMREESGLADEAEASLMALQHADWLGAVVGLVRAGIGASAEPQELVGYINRCPEVEGELDYDDAGAVESAFELILPAWEAAGAVDGTRRLTALGRWGLPRALAWAWNGEFGSR